MGNSGGALLLRKNKIKQKLRPTQFAAGGTAAFLIREIFMKKTKKRMTILSVLGLVTALSLLVGGTCYALSISEGENAAVNITQYCNEGASGASGTAGSSTYRYTMLDGDTTYLRMMYLADSNQEGAAAKTDAGGTPIWVYCIEYGTAIESYNGRTATTLADSAVWNNLSQEQQLGITLATMYGCPVSGLGTSMADSYAATQVLIWEYQTGIRTSVTEDKKQDAGYRGGTIEQNRFTNVLSGKAGQSAYDALVQKVLRHQTTPSFSGSEIVLEYDRENGDYRAVLTDTNGVLQDYSVASDTDAVAVASAENTLTLISKTPVTGVGLQLSRNLPALSSQALLALAPNGTGQAAIVGQQSNAVAARATVRTATGNLRVEKTASDGAISGIHFTVTGQGETYELETDENGVAELTNIPSGEYTVTEGAMGEQYIAVTAQTVFVGNNTTETVQFHNQVKTGTVVLQKIDAVTEKGLPDVAFDLYAEGTEEPLERYRTDENGTITVENLPFGSYFFREVEAPEGYLPLEEDLRFSVTEDGQTIFLEAKNQPVPEVPTTPTTTAPQPSTTVPATSPVTTQPKAVSTADETVMLPLFLAAGFGLAGFLILRFGMRKNERR